MALGMANGTLTNCMYRKLFDRFWNSFSSWDVSRSKTQGFVRKADTLRSRLAQLRVIVVDDRSLCMIAEIWKHCDVEADTSQLVDNISMQWKIPCTHLSIATVIIRNSWGLADFRIRLFATPSYVCGNQLLILLLTKIRIFLLLRI